MSTSRRKIVFLVSLPAFIFIVWFGWMSYTQSRTEWIQGKVSQAMSTSIESLAPQWPRIETRSSIAGGVYYAPEINDPQQTFELYRHILELLNQDVSVPPLKVTQVSLTNDIGSTEDTLICRATVEFALIGGIDKEIVVQGAVKIPHFTTLN